MNNCKKARNVQDDCIRIIALILMVTTHSNKQSLSPILLSLLPVITLTCNGLYFMLSGKYNLQFDGTTPRDYLNYYFRKFTNLLIPYTIYSLAYFLITQIPIHGRISLDCFLSYLINDNCLNHLWFMAPFFGAVLSAPFLSKMFQKMTNTELKVLLVVAFSWDFLRLFLVSGIHFSFYYRDWIFDDWMFYFILGYITERLYDEIKIKIIYMLGLCSIFITFLLNYHFVNYSENSLDLSPVYIMVVLFFYLFFRHTISVKNIHLQKVFTLLTSYVFGIYAFHPLFLSKIGDLFNPNISDSWQIIWILVLMFKVLITILLSLVLTLIVDNALVHPIQKLCWKVYSHFVSAKT